MNRDVILTNQATPENGYALEKMYVGGNKFTLAEFTMRFGQLPLSTVIEISSFNQVEIKEPLILLNGKISYDLSTREIHHAGTQQISELSAIEDRIFRYLVSPPNVVVPSEALMYLSPREQKLHTVNMHVSNLRKKLLDKRDHLKSIRGTGYILLDQI